MKGPLIQRRDFLKVGSALCFKFALPVSVSAEVVDPESERLISAWVRVAADGTVTIASPASEMGQGSMTAIPMIFAEEFDADWNKVHIEFSPADDGEFYNPTWWIRGIMLTLGSSTVSGYYDSVRRHGAQARKILMLTVGRHWGVPAHELGTEPGVVVHQKSSRRMSYGEIAAKLEPVTQIPEIEETDLKKETDFRIIGSDIPRWDVPPKTDGSASYSIDIELPEMLYATVMHSPVNGAVPLGVQNRKLVEQHPGVLKVIMLPDAVAVVASNYESAWQAEKILQVQWSEVENLKDFDGNETLERHIELIRNHEFKGMPIQEKGDVHSALKQVVKIYQREYKSDYLYHAQLEPLNAVARVSKDGRNVEVWVGSQAPTHCVRSVAAELGISVDKVTLNRTYMGGGFGRRGAQDHDYVIDAVRLSRLMNTAVKVIWSRESDIRAGRFKPMKAMRLEAGEDRYGKIISWRHRTISDEALKQSDPYRYEKGNGWPVISSSGMDIDYGIENVLAEIFDPDTGIRAAPLRGIGGTVNKFASESFLDEIAGEQGIDPLDLRLQLLAEYEEPLRVLNAVAEMSGWRHRKEGSGMGLAFESVRYPTACVVQAALDRKSGVIGVTRVWMALYAGLAVHPRNIVGQIESQVIFTLSTLLKERITLRQGQVEQSNFHDYPVMRMSEIPEIKVDILTRTGAKPLGIGDARCEPVPAALGNAIADLTGKRLRHMPFLPERVSEALA